MFKVVPDDIVIETFKSELISRYDGGLLFRVITTSFTTIGNIQIRADIQHGEDVSVMEYYEDDTHLKYYFSPNITKKFFKKIFAYPKLNSQQYRIDLAILINNIRQYNLHCQEVDNESRK